jgi:predicted nucleic acid-binding protein
VSFLLDTNVVSELMKPRPDPLVLAWAEPHEEACFLSALTVGEIERGIGLLPIGRKKDRLTAALTAYLQAVGEQILSFDVAIAHRWAALTVRWQRQGKRLSVLDSMIEATALHWNLTLVTRNTSDFVDGARTLNPWAKI